MDRLLANGTVNAAQFGQGQPLVLLHSLLSDRASFDAIVPLLSQSFRVIVPELPGFGVLQMAIRHPNIATKLILADCGAAFSANGREAFRNMAAASSAKGLAAITDVAMRRLFAPEFQADHPELMRDRREACLRTDPEVFRAACDALAGLDLRPELGRVEVPVLVLVGEHDEATPPPMSHELAAGLPHARLEIIAGCAHVPQLQSPEMFLEAIGNFLPVS